MACPHEGCDWSGNLLPSLIRGGSSQEIASMQRAWFRCPRCEVRIIDDKVAVLPAHEHGG